MLPTKYCPVSIHTEYIKCNAQKAGLCKIDNTYYPLYHYHSHFISPKLLTIKVSNKFSLSVYIYSISFIHLSIYLSIYLYIYIYPCFCYPHLFGVSPIFTSQSTSPPVKTPDEISKRHLWRSLHGSGFAMPGPPGWEARPGDGEFVEDLPQKY